MNNEFYFIAFDLYTNIHSVIFTVGFCFLSIGSTSCCTIAYSFNIATWVHLCWVYRWRHKVEKQRSMLLLSYLASVPSSTHSHTDAPDPNQHCHNQHCNLKTHITSTLAKHTCRTERVTSIWLTCHGLSSITFITSSKLRHSQTFEGSLTRSFIHVDIPMLHHRFHLCGQQSNWSCITCPIRWSAISFHRFTSSSSLAC